MLIRCPLAAGLAELEEAEEIRTADKHLIVRSPSARRGEPAQPKAGRGFYRRSKYREFLLTVERVGYLLFKLYRLVGGDQPFETWCREADKELELALLLTRDGSWRAAQGHAGEALRAMAREVERVERTGRQVDGVATAADVRKFLKQLEEKGR